MDQGIVSFFVVVSSSQVCGRLGVKSCGFRGRLDSVRAVLANSTMDDPLDNEEQLQDQMESMPAMCRFLYDATCEYICSIYDPLLGAYTAWGRTGGHSVIAGLQPGAKESVVASSAAFILICVTDGLAFIFGRDQFAVPRVERLHSEDTLA